MRDGGYVPAIELDNDFAGAMVVDFLEFTNVAYGRSKVSMLRSIKRCTSGRNQKTCKIFAWS